VIKKSFLIISVFLFSLAAFVVTVSAQDILLTNLNGKKVNLSGIKGKPAIIFFWTTWCPHCSREIRELNKEYSAIKKAGISVYIVNIGESEHKVRMFLKNMSINFDVLLDRDSFAAESFDIMGVPTYVLLDKKGKVVSTLNRLPPDYKILLL